MSFRDPSTVPITITYWQTPHGSSSNTPTQQSRYDSNEVTKIWIDRMQKVNKDGQNLAPHSIASMSFYNKPRFIHELSNENIKKTVLQATILDVKLKVYSGCLNCQNAMRIATAFCPKCKRRKYRGMAFGKMRVMDFSGLLYVNVKTDAMEKILDIFGYEDADEWMDFCKSGERANYIFQNIMLEIEKKSDEWECTDAESVDWAVYKNYLQKKGGERQLPSRRASASKSRNNFRTKTILHRSENLGK
ncbi:unnamed protein product [Caenorhabditis nigoni]